MKIISPSMAAVVFASLLAAGAGAKEGRKPDAWITTKVKSVLATHKNVSAFGTNVETKRGIVTIKGEVDTLAEKELTARYVGEVEGVRSVNNLIVVRADGDRDVRDDRDDRDDHPREGAATKVINNVGDAMLTGRVKSALAAQRATSAFHTDVDTERGAVTLHGKAKSGAERDLAEKVVRDVKGVESVDNQIEVP